MTSLSARTEQSPGFLPEVLLGLGLLGLHSALAFLTPLSTAAGWRFWAPQAARYLDPWAAAALYCVAAVVIVIVAWALALARAPVPKSLVAPPPTLAPGAQLLLIFAPTALLWLARAKYSFLGDNLLRVQQALAGQSASHDAGVMAFYHHALRLLGATDLESGRQVFVGISVACGLVYAWSALRLAMLLAGLRSDGGASRHALWIYLAILAGGSSLLFAGYVEVYPPIVALLMAATWLGVRALHRAEFPWMAIALVLGAAALHRVAALWIPFVLYSAARSRAVPRAHLFSAALSLAAFLACVFLAGRTGLLLPIWPTPDRPYAWLSVPHLSDFLNAQALGSLAALVLAPIAAVRFWRGSSNEAFHRTSNGVPTGIAAALLLAWLPPTIALAFFRPILGATDWDLLALSAPFGLIFAVGTLDFGRLARTLIVVTALQTSLWLASFASDASIIQIRDLVETDRADYFKSHPAPLHLSFVYASNGLRDAQREELERGAALYPKDARYFTNLAVLAREERNWAEAERQAIRAHETGTASVLVLDVLFDTFQAQQRGENQFMVGEAILAQHQRDARSVEAYLSARRLEFLRQTVASLRAASGGRLDTLKTAP